MKYSNKKAVNKINVLFLYGFYIYLMFISEIRIMEWARNSAPKHFAQNYKNKKSRALKGKKKTEKV